MRDSWIAHQSHALRLTQPLQVTAACLSQIAAPVASTVRRSVAAIRVSHRNQLS